VSGGLGCLDRLPRSATLAHSGYAIADYTDGAVRRLFSFAPPSYLGSLLLAPPRPWLTGPSAAADGPARLRGSLGRCLPPDPRQTHIKGATALGNRKRFAALTR